MDKKKRVEKVVKKHVIWSMGVGLIPFPGFDIAGVTAIQMDLLKQLAGIYDVDYSKSTGKAFVSALAGSTLAKLASSFVKAVPGIGTLIGGVSMSVLSGASTYGIAQVAVAHFENEGDLENVDLEWAKKEYEEAYEEGKAYATKLEKEKGEAPKTTKEIIEALDKLGDLKEKGVITEEEFEKKKKDLLDRL